MAGPPKGNRNACKENRLWSETIHRVVAQDKAKKLRAAAEKLVDRAIEGDVSALRELGDRLEGKVAQPVTGEGGGPIQVQEVPWLRARSL